jgi:cytochrome b subunit of formate dehydrogenase
MSIPAQNMKIKTPSRRKIVTEALPSASQKEGKEKEIEQVLPKTYIRFNLSERIEHAILLVSFTILGITGLAQKYADSPAGGFTLQLFGGIENSRIIHHFAAFVLIAVSIYHIMAVAYRVFVMRATLNMLPLPSDFVHLYHDILFYIGKRKRKAYYGRYNYAEKAEYLAVVWGTVIMAITGFMMLNPIATTRFLPGEFIPAAKAAHGGEALLAVLAIILWHFYHVHLKHFNKSMFTGKMTEEEMQDEHPAELAMIKAGEDNERPSALSIRQRENMFFPIAMVVTAALTFGLYKFATFEVTAITTIPPGETAPIFVPFTPTPSPIPVPTATSGPGGLKSWDGGISQLFASRCGTCHVQGNLGGLSLADYQSALKGGDTGPAIVPGDPSASVLVKVQSAGGHPGQLSQSELDQIIQWIQAGAPEK